MASNPPSTLKPDGIDYEDLFGYNDYAFPIKLPELPNDMSFNNFSYFEWIQRYAELNVESSNFSQETTNSVYGKVVQLKCQSQGLRKKLLAQRRTPKACRLWFDIKLARAGYINRFSLAKFTTYGSVLKVDPTTNYETIPMSNNLFCGPFGHNNELTIVILPYYAESPLEKMDYLDFLDALLKLNPGLNLNRLEVFKIWFTVITTEYPFEDDKKIQRVIDQAISEPVEKEWALMYNDVDELRQYSHPNRKDLEALRTHTALMILPGCAFFRSSVETCTYVAFRIGVQILNRDKSIDAGSTASAWRAMVRYRVLNFEFRIPSSQKDSMLIEYDKHNNDGYFNGLQALKGLGTMAPLDCGTHMMIKVAENLHDYIVPLAQPVWCNLPPHLSFARLLKHLNPERALTREVTRTLWLGSCPGLAKEAVRAASNLADEIRTDPTIDDLWKQPLQVPVAEQEVNDMSRPLRHATVLERRPKRALTDDRDEEEGNQLVQSRKKPSISTRASQTPSVAPHVSRRHTRSFRAARTPRASQPQSEASIDYAENREYTRLRNNALVDAIIKQMEEDEAAVVEGRDPEMPLLKRRLQDALNGYTTASQLPFLSTRNIDSDSAAIRMRNRALCDALILQMESDDVVAVEDRDPGMPLLKRRLQDALDGYNPNDAMNMT